MAVELFEIVSPTETALVARAATDADGRTETPPIGGRPVPMATYQMRLALGDHFRHLGLDLPQSPFRDIVPIRLGVAEPEGHYHVPLVANPWSYQPHRGS